MALGHNPAALFLCPFTQDLHLLPPDISKVPTWTRASIYSAICPLHNSKQRSSNLYNWWLPPPLKNSASRCRSHCWHHGQASHGLSHYLMLSSKKIIENLAIAVVLQQKSKHRHWDGVALTTYWNSWAVFRYVCGDNNGKMASCELHVVFVPMHTY